MEGGMKTIETEKTQKQAGRKWRKILDFFSTYCARGVRMGLSKLLHSNILWLVEK